MRKSDNPNRRIELFLVSSIIFHLILFFVFSLITITGQDDEEIPMVVEFVEDEEDPGEFNDFPQENETDEEVNSDRLSDKDRKVEEESIVKGSPLGGGTPAPEPRPPSEITPPPSPPDPPVEEETQPLKVEGTPVPEEPVEDGELIAKREEPPKESPKEPPTRSDKERLTIEDLLPDSGDVARLDQPLGTSSPDVKEEETVSLNTSEFKYYAYFSHIKRAVEMAWNYPLEAQKNGWGGRLNLIFTIESSGRVSDVMLLSSSGYTILDDAAIRAIKFASPFNPIPESIGVKRLNINASFEYITSLFGVRW